MAYTYNEPSGGVFAVARDEVRYLLSDTTPAAPHSLTDSEIEFELAAVSQNRRLAAANAATKMSTRYGSSAATQKSVGNLSISKDYSSQGAMYRQLSADLRSGATSGSVAGPIFTGTYTDPEFYLGQHDNLGG